MTSRMRRIPLWVQVTLWSAGALTCPALLAAADPTQAPPTSESVVTYHHPDAVGTPYVETDAAGQMVATHLDGPFGEVLAPDAVTDPARPSFAGKRQDPATGLHDFSARDYASAYGRFTSVDPVNFQSKSLLAPQGFNLYAYGLNNPYKFVDPDGRDPDFVVTTQATYAFGYYEHQQQLAFIELSAQLSPLSRLLESGMDWYLNAPDKTSENMSRAGYNDWLSGGAGGVMFAAGMLTGGSEERSLTKAKPIVGAVEVGSKRIWVGSARQIPKARKIIEEALAKVRENMAVFNRLRAVFEGASGREGMTEVERLEEFLRGPPGKLLAEVDYDRPIADIGSRAKNLELHQLQRQYVDLLWGESELISAQRYLDTREDRALADHIADLLK